ncbi:hypothetical protein [Pararhodospirillum photometricum]|uniref:hypothetical protein n=1 Tax=Pararhodospirillum photometricum TaxID=1084 RepID=UPI0012FF0E9C|nr:hypothetical protein [Pararhodospirillum photometricum]
MKTPGERAGTVLLDVALALGLFGLILAGGLRLAPGILEERRRHVTEERLARADLALKGYYLALRTLPCPAAATDPSGVAAPCPDSTNAAGRYVFGALPWRTLGLMPEDGGDGWGRRLLYAVNAAQITTPLPCAVPTAATQRGGLLVLGRDPSVTPPETARALLVLISSGPDGQGGLTPSGQRVPLDAAADPATQAHSPPDTPAPGRESATTPLYAAAATPSFDDLVLPQTLASFPGRGRVL